MLVRVSAGEGEPIVGVSVRPSAGAPGVTDEKGVARITIAGDEGTEIDLSVACPDGYAAPPSVTRVTVPRRLLPD